MLCNYIDLPRVEATPSRPPESSREQTSRHVRPAWPVDTVRDATRPVSNVTPCLAATNAAGWGGCERQAAV
jgi:hypothetical protein